MTPLFTLTYEAVKFGLGFTAFYILENKNNEFRQFQYGFRHFSHLLIMI